MEKLEPLFQVTGDRSARARDECHANPVHRILVVDDDTCIRELNSQVLIRSGYQVDTAEDGAAGWEALLALKYGLLITDNQMPKVSGIELIQKVRSARMLLPVVLATGTPPRDTEALQLAALLQKPVTQAELLHTVQEALQWQMPDHPTQKAKQLAARLLACEAALVKTAGVETSAASRVCEKARGPFSRLTGVEAYRSLLLRVLAVAGAEVSWVLEIQIKPDGSLQNLDEIQATLNRATVATGEAALVSQLLRLLVVLIGPALTLILLHDIWPKMDDLGL